MNKNILLTGFMGTGKTTISHELHRMARMEEIDLDAYIVEKTGCSIRSDEHTSELQSRCSI